jgi:hypothetical protein
MFIGLNPSRANEVSLDPTITRVRRFTADFGYGGFYMMNLFSYVTPFPAKLIETNMNTTLNDHWLKEVGDQCRDVIFAWGTFKEAQERAKQVIAMFPEAKALIINKDGSPRHPLYVPGNVKPIKFV